jgi:hypothetical protein
VKKFHEYNATHIGWFLFCPVYIAEIETAAPTPIPRFVPGWWLDFNLWMNDGIQWCIWFFAPHAVGFIFYGVKELSIPKTVRVRAIEEDVP